MSSQSVIKPPARKTSSSKSSSGIPIREDADDTPNKGDSRRNNDREGDQDRFGHPKKGQQQIPNHQNDHQHNTTNTYVWRPASPPGMVDRSTPTLISTFKQTAEQPASRRLHGTSAYEIVTSETSELHTQHHDTRSRTIADAIEILEEHACMADDERKAFNFAIVAQLAEWTQNENYTLLTAALRPPIPNVKEAYLTRIARIRRKAGPSGMSSRNSEAPGALKSTAKEDEEGEKESEEESEVEREEQSEDESDEESDDHSDDFKDAYTHPVNSPQRRLSFPVQPASHDIATSATDIPSRPRPFPTRPEQELDARDQHYMVGKPRTGRPSLNSVPRSARLSARTIDPVSQANLPQGSGRSQLQPRTQIPTTQFSNLKPPQQGTLPHRGEG